MPIYEYTAITADGKSKAGVLDADTPKDARAKLRAERVHVISIKEYQEFQKEKKPGLMARLTARKKLSTISLITRQLATLLSSGIPLRESFSALIEQLDDEKQIQTAFRDIREKVSAGMSFGDALSNHPYYFSELYVNMVKAGEAAGTLDKILDRLADYLQSQSKTQGKIAAALTYPIVMVFIGTGVVIFLMTFVVPKIRMVIDNIGKQLPLPTQILIWVSDFLVNYWYLLLIGVVAVFIALKIAIGTTAGKRAFDRALLKLPIFGDLFRKQAISRFSVTLSTLLQSGIQVVDSLKIVRNIVNNMLLAETLDDVREKILEGTDIASPLKKSGVFPPVLGYMIAIGEQTGQLESILKKVAINYDQEIEITTQKVTALLEPLMIILLATVVGFIVLAIILPILEMSQIQ